MSTAAGADKVRRERFDKSSTGAERRDDLQLIASPDFTIRTAQVGDSGPCIGRRGEGDDDDSRP